MHKYLFFALKNKVFVNSLRDFAQPNISFGINLCYEQHYERTYMTFAGSPQAIPLAINDVILESGIGHLNYLFEDVGFYLSHSSLRRLIANQEPEIQAKYEPYGVFRTEKLPLVYGKIKPL